MPRYRWVEPEAAAGDAALSALGLGSRLLSSVLARRGVSNAAGARDFLFPGPEQFGDPFDLPDLDLALARIRAAIRRGTPIAVFGDYDVDGVTSTAMLVRALSGLGGDLRAHLPHRVRDGYGLHQAAVERMVAGGAGLLIAVDCGTGNSRELELAHRLGLTTVVLDHHHVIQHELPGTAFVSPQRPEARGFRDFCGAGVVFQVLRALLGEEAAAEYLPLAATATVADVVPLLGANRAIVALGLGRFERAPLGLLALAQEAGVEARRLSAREIGFALGPRINAAGRLAEPELALELMLTEDVTRARELARSLGQLNVERQRRLELLLRDAEAQLERLDATSLVVVSHPEWPVGLVGLAASRLSERFGRPVVVLAEENGVSRGSARSVDGFNIVEALDECRDLLDAYGGHSQAAGLTVQSARLTELALRLNQLAHDAFGPDGPQVGLHLDAEVQPADLTLENAKLLRGLEPFGHGNPQPRLLLRAARTREAQTTRDGKHLRFRVQTSRNRSIKGIFFGGAEHEPLFSSGQPVDLALSLKVSTWNGTVDPEVEVLDVRLSTA